MLRTLPLAWRTFLFSAMVITAALLASFLAVSKAIERQVRVELRKSFLDHASEIEAKRIEHRQNVARLAGVLSESVGLKVGLGLLRENTASQEKLRMPEIRRTLEEQLRSMSEQLGYQLLAVADADDRPIAAVSERDGIVKAVDAAQIHSPSGDLLWRDKTAYEMMRVPVNLANEHMGTLTLGKRLDLASFRSEGVVALLGQRHLLASTIAGNGEADLEREIAGCGNNLKNCDVRFGGQTYMVMPMRQARSDDELTLVSLRSMDAATRAFTEDFSTVFVVIAAGSFIIALLGSAVVSRSIANPLRELVQRLSRSEISGELPNDFGTHSGTSEVDQLAGAFNRAAEAIGDSRRSLDNAYLEFIETMARALDARDPYTSGHSDRVSLRAVAIAQEYGCPAEEIETIRIGARLHDIGKIGIPDEVLQKPGKLTKEEFDLIRKHPTIGRRILERVGRFQRYLPIVELHHEDHDGSGYPLGLRGEEIPLSARIVHVADVYDALTSDRAYRQRMSEEKVLAILRYERGRQFDPQVLDAFLSVLSRENDAGRDTTRGLLSLIARTGPVERTAEEEIHVEIRKSA